MKRLIVLFVVMLFGYSVGIVACCTLAIYYPSFENRVMLIAATIGFIVYNLYFTEQLKKYRNKK